MEIINKNISKIYIVSGLLYGDEGKGTTVEYLVKSTNSNLVIRFNGGPQAAHHVVINKSDDMDATFHCFSQFSSGSFFNNCHTLLSKFMLISPHRMIIEAKKLLEIHNLYDIWDRIHIDYECFIITPYHQMINRISEILRGNKSHGSTGLGVGVCADEAFFNHPQFFPLGETFYNIDNENNKLKNTTLQVNDLFDKTNLKSKIMKIISEKIEQAKILITNFSIDNNLHFHKDYLDLHKNDLFLDKDNILKKANNILYEFISEYTSNNLTNFYLKFVEDYKNIFCKGIDIIKDKIEKSENFIFEGAQGMLLDRVYGIFPHLTKTICNDLNVIKLLEDCKEYKIIKIGVLRAYSSRHGNGPFLTHVKEWAKLLKEEHNQHSRWQGEFKVGPFDFIMAKYGIEIFKPDYLSITCLDKILNVVDYNDNSIEICDQYRINGSFVNEEIRNILENNKLFIYENVANNYIINNILKRKVEDAYCNLDLLKVLKNAEYVNKKIHLQNLENNNEDNNEYLNFLKNNHYEILLNKFKMNDINLISEYLKYIQIELKIPIAILSFGPTHIDKIQFNEI